MNVADSLGSTLDPEANPERCTLVDMQFRRVLPCSGFALASYDFVGCVGGTKDIWRGCRHTRSHSGSFASRLRRHPRAGEKLLEQACEVRLA